MMIDIFENVEAVIFDMDGLLVDSEPFWKQAEKEVFGKLGLQLTDEILRQVMGFRLSEAVEHWYHYQPWLNPDLKVTEEEILQRVSELILERAEAMPGVMVMLEYCSSQKLKMGLASSSSLRLINLVVDKLKIRNYFQVILSAEFEPFGKPHPGIFIKCADELKTPYTRCLVFEDSVNGVVAAKAARMKCVAVPEHIVYDDPRFAIANVKVARISDLLS